MTGRATLRPPRGAADREAARVLLADAEAFDGVRPLSEQAELALRSGDDRGSLLLVNGGDAGDDDGGNLGDSGAPASELLGLVHVEAVAPDEPAVAELVVAPAARGLGHGSRLLAAVRRAAGPAGLRVWAHGDLPPARALAARAGARPVRLLHQMHRPLTAAAPLPEPPPPPAGVRLRAFRPGADDEAWLAVNARAFAAHPEQGRWTLGDLLARQAEPWFDPSGFLVAERESDGSLLGFHWTKTHGSGPAAMGEVYVVGVDPAAQGLGLGRVLVLAGLAHLAAAGLGTVLLYVDDDNAAAMRLYRGLGFTPATTDALYEVPASADTAVLDPPGVT